MYHCSHSPAVVDGVVYIGSNDDYLYALNADNGALIWKFGTGGDVYSSPTVADGVVYFGSDDNSINAVDIATGSQVRAYQSHSLALQSHYGDLPSRGA